MNESWTEKYQRALQAQRTAAEAAAQAEAAEREQERTYAQVARTYLEQIERNIVTPFLRAVANNPRARSLASTDLEEQQRWNRRKHRFETFNTVDHGPMWNMIGANHAVYIWKSGLWQSSRIQHGWSEPGYGAILSGSSGSPSIDHRFSIGRGRADWNLGWGPGYSNNRDKIDDLAEIAREIIRQRIHSNPDGSFPAPLETFEEQARNVYVATERTVINYMAEHRIEPR